jgi:hypothetical protein
MMPIRLRQWLYLAASGCKTLYLNPEPEPMPPNYAKWLVNHEPKHLCGTAGTLSNDYLTSGGGDNKAVVCLMVGTRRPVSTHLESLLKLLARAQIVLKRPWSELNLNLKAA